MAARQFPRSATVFLTVLAMVLGSFPAALVPGTATANHGVFVDLSGVLAEEIHLAHNSSLVDGFGPDGRFFRQELNVTRAQFVKMIVRAVEQATGQQLETGDEPFSDVAPGQTLYAYVVKAYIAGFVQGYGDGTFGYHRPVTRQEAAAILRRALELPAGKQDFPDVPAHSRFAEDIGAVAALGIMQGYGDGRFGAGDHLTRGQAAAMAYRAYKYLAKQAAKYAVVSVEAVSSSTLQVAFNKPIEDVDAVEILVERDGIPVQLTPELAAGSTSVELVSSSKLQPGTYRVTVRGLDFAQGKNTGSVKVEPERVSKIEFSSDHLFTIPDPSARHAVTSYRVYNQYGENITEVKAADLRWSAMVTAPVGANGTGQVPGEVRVEADKNGKVTVIVADEDFAFEAGKHRVALTVVDPDTQVSASKTFTITEASRISSISFGRLLLPDGNTRLYAGRKDAGRIEITIGDAHGPAPADVEQVKNEILLLYPGVLDGRGVTFAQIAGDGEGHLYVSLDTRNVRVAGKVTLTAVVLSTGATSSTTLDISLPPHVANVELGRIEGLVAEGDTDFAVPITVYDQFGNKMAAKEVSISRISLFATGGLAGRLEIQKDGESLRIGLKKNATVGEKGTAVIVVSVPATGDTETLQVEIHERRVPVQLVRPVDPATHLLQGAQTTLRFGFKDQYGAELAVRASDAGEFSYELELTGDTAAIAAVTAGGGTGVSLPTTEPDNRYKARGTNLADLTNVTVVASDDESGTATLTVRLLKDGAPVDAVSVQLTVQARPGALEYAIAEIPPLYWDANGNGWGPDMEPGAYAEPVQIVARDPSGHKYAINVASVREATASRPEIGVRRVGHQLLVWSQAKERPEKDITGTITVVLITGEGETVTLKAPVTISAQGREPVAIYVRDRGLGQAEVTRQAPEGKPVGEVQLTLVGTRYVMTDPKAYVVFQDQFGRYFVPKYEEYTITSAHEAGLTVDEKRLYIGPSGRFTIPPEALRGAHPGDSFNVIVQTQNGKKARLTITIRRNAPAPSVKLHLPSGGLSKRGGSLTVSVSNPANGVDFDRVRFRITVTAPRGYFFRSEDDVVISSGNTRLPLSWNIDLPTILDGWWGPEDGFPMPAGYSSSTTFQMRFGEDAPTGTYTVWIAVVDVENYFSLTMTTVAVSVKD